MLSQGQPILLSLCLHNDPRQSMESPKWASASSCQKVLLSKMSFWGKSHYLNWASASSLPKFKMQASHKVPIRHTSVILPSYFGLDFGSRGCFLRIRQLRNGPGVPVTSRLNYSRMDFGPWMPFWDLSGWLAGQEVIVPKTSFCGPPDSLSIPPWGHAIPWYSIVFQGIPSYSKLVQAIPRYSKLVQASPSCSKVSCPGCSKLFCGIARYFKLVQAMPS